MKLRTLAGMSAVGLVGLLLPSTSTHADSIRIYASNRQCVARWINNPDKFNIDDLDDDNDYCYVQYGYSSTNLPSRIAHPQDVEEAASYPVNTGTNARIYWKICKERQDDPDICSSVQNNVT